MRKTVFVLISASFLIFGMICNAAAAEPLNKSYVQSLLTKPPRNEEKLKTGTLHGCVHIPARGFMQRLMVGFEMTGESCSVTVNRDNTVRVSFLGDAVIPVVSTSTERYRTDIFIGELGNDQVLIVQHHRGDAVGITQTVYDENGDVVYGRSGVGVFIRECNLGMTTSEKLAGKKNCSK